MHLFDELLHGIVHDADLVVAAGRNIDREVSVGNLYDIVGQGPDRFCDKLVNELPEDEADDDDHDDHEDVAEDLELVQLRQNRLLIYGRNQGPVRSLNLI